jgi:PTS system galactitol-specific IIB component
VSKLDRTKKILFVCGTGGITSAIAEQEVLKACKDEGMDVLTIRCVPTEVASRARDVDIIVSTTALGSGYPVPVVNGLGLITGVNKKETLEQIVELLKNIT